MNIIVGDFRYHLRMKQLKLSTVNKAIQKEFPTVFLVKDNGFFFLASDDKEWADRIADLHQQAIYVKKVNDMTLDQWLNDVRGLFANRTQNWTSCTAV